VAAQRGCPRTQGIEVTSHIRKYYTLLERDGNQWVINFGDYKKHIVQYELDELWYNYRIDMIGKPQAGRLKKGEKFKIIATGDSQENINKAVAAENFALKVMVPVSGV